MCKHSLRLIVGRVSHCDSPTNARSDQRTEIVVPRPPRGVLEIGPLLFCFLRNVNGSRVKLQPMVRRQFRDELFICIGSFAAQFVIEVHHAQHDSQLLAQLQKQKQQRHGIRPAGHSRAHAIPRLQHSVLFQGGENLLLEESRIPLVSGCACFYTSHESPITGSSSRLLAHPTTPEALKVLLWTPVDIAISVVDILRVPWHTSWAVDVPFCKTGGLRSLTTDTMCQNLFETIGAFRAINNSLGRLPGMQIPGFFFAKQPDSNESLILAQNERWRRA